MQVGHRFVWGMTLLGYYRELDPTEKFGHSNFLYSRIIHLTREVSDYWILCAEMCFVPGCIYWTLPAKHTFYTFCLPSAYKSSCSVKILYSNNVLVECHLVFFFIFSSVNKGTQEGQNYENCSFKNRKKNKSHLPIRQNYQYILNVLPPYLTFL